ncbi:MAG TPA: hypothetical protein PLF13_12370 [candidate division Zixibacteria bacterium]|nr:hypothetical protein [candidate division Zixibacteria bacterium]
MKQLLVTIAFLLALSALVSAEELSEDQQKEIIIDYMLATGQHVPELALAETDRDEEAPHHWCGMPAIANFVDNYKSFDPELMKSLGAELITRPTGLPETYGSPSGKFLIHYAVTGDDAIYEPTVDNNHNSIPDYIDEIAATLDYVHSYIVDTLGFPAPLSDDFYPAGGDERFDVYLLSMSYLYYGQTYPDSLIVHHFDSDSVVWATSYMQLRNDYTGLYGYEDRPLDAMRATVAHEYFHSVQFSMDYSEASGTTAEKRYWMEMSAVWMEEEIYDDINDYYYYLPTFFNHPEQSIQQFTSILDMHPYSSVVFPIFLTEKYDRGVVRAIWEHCEELGLGDQFLTSATMVVDSITNGTVGWAETFAEFALWNWFTGSRADSPNNIGYSERAAYPAIPDSCLHTYRAFPVLLRGNENDTLPDHNAAYYLKLDDINNTWYDTTFWICNDGSFPNCSDSTKVTDTIDNPYDIVHIDSLFTIWLLNGDPGDSDNPTLPEGWGVNIVYQSEIDPDSMVIDAFLVPDDAVNRLDLINPRQYSSLTFIMTPASSEKQFYDNIHYRSQLMGYYIPEKVGVDSSLIDVMASVLVPFPNPCVISEMDEPKVTFKFQMPTDETSYPVYDVSIDPLLIVDIYSLAGERVATVGDIVKRNSRRGLYYTEWDLTNEAGREVASGIYLVYARLFTREGLTEMLAEGTAKVAVIR